MNELPTTRFSVSNYIMTENKVSLFENCTQAHNLSIYILLKQHLPSLHTEHALCVGPHDP